MTEIRTNGPVLTAIRYYEDLQYYGGGIYIQRFGDRIDGYYSFKIVGWGETDGNKKYWNALAWFGENWDKFE
jgi:hypothetical protein